jgi:beta-lactamase regulating signal transducer with metallopeptidase domain
MHTIIDQWYRFSVAITWQTCAIMAVILCAYVLLAKRSAALKYCLLCLVLIKFLVPPSWGVPVSWTPLIESMRSVVRGQEQPVALTAKDAGTIDEQLTKTAVVKTSIAVPKTINRPESHSVIPAVSTHSVAARPQVSIIEQKQWSDILFGVWLFCVTMLSMLHIYRVLRIQKQYCQAQPVTNMSVCNEVASLCDRMKIRSHVPVMHLSDIYSPVVVGIIRPRLILPTESLSVMSTEQLRPLLIHELAHVKRLDLCVNVVQILLQIIWFFNPVLWIVNHLIRRERELACDDMVIHYNDQQRKVYAQSIMDMLNYSGGRVSFSPGLLGIFKEKNSDLYLRIQRILKGKTGMNPYMTIRETVAIVLISVLLLPLTYAQKSDGDHRYDKFLHTRWDGSMVIQEKGKPIGFVNKMSLLIDTVSGDWFGAETIYFNDSVVTWVEGRFNRDSLWFSQVDFIEDGGKILVMGDTNYGVFRGDSIVGTWVYPLASESLSPFYLTKRKTYPDRTTNQEMWYARFVKLRSRTIDSSLCLQVQDTLRSVGIQPSLILMRSDYAKALVQDTLFDEIDHIIEAIGTKSNSSNQSNLFTK